MKKYMIAILALGFLAAPVMAAERSVGSTSVAEKSSKPEAAKGDLRDCLYAAFGSKGINHHVVKVEKPWKWNWVVKKCQHCNYGKTGA